jgi:class 3 adenylate cyclase
MVGLIEFASSAKKMAAVGETKNLASKLQDIAASGSIVVSE